MSTLAYQTPQELIVHLPEQAQSPTWVYTEVQGKYDTSKIEKVSGTYRWKRWTHIRYDPSFPKAPTGDVLAVPMPSAAEIDELEVHLRDTTKANPVQKVLLDQVRYGLAHAGQYNWPKLLESIGDYNHTERENDSLADWYEKCAYVGFNLSAMVARALMNSKKSWTAVQKDMMLTALLFARRGASVDKIMKRSEQEVKDHLNTMINVYGLKYKTGTAPLVYKSDDLTMGRIGILMAKEVVLFFHWYAGVHQKKIESVISDRLSGCGIPAVFNTSIFASVLPARSSAPEAEAIFNAYVAVMLVWDRVINSKKDKTQSAISVRQFQNVANSSSVLSDVSRNEAMIKIGLASGTKWNANLTVTFGDIEADVMAIYNQMP